MLVTLAVVIAGLSTVVAAPANAATAPAFAATASLTPTPRYVGDYAGSVYEFTVRNTGSTHTIGAVEIRRPIGWTVRSCPAPPSGWSRVATSERCRFRTAVGRADDIKPGQSRTFLLKARTAPGTTDRRGTWAVVVSRTSAFGWPSMLKQATAGRPGLTQTLRTFEVTSVVVRDAAATPGSACPTANKTAPPGSSRTIIVCGRNHARTNLTPVSWRSSLGGSFIGSAGLFASGSIPHDSNVVVLAQWKSTQIVGVPGSNYRVVTRVGAATNRLSPVGTFTGYSASRPTPVAEDDGYSTDEDSPLVANAGGGVLSNDHGFDTEPLHVTDNTQPAHGSVTLAPDGSFTYTPDANFSGSDSFEYTINDTHSDSTRPGTVTIAVNPVDDAPTAADVSDSTDEDTSVVVTLSGDDVDGEPLAFSIEGDVADGELGPIGAPSCSNGTCTATVTYTPDLNVFGSDSFTYTVHDGNGDSNPGTVSLTVGAVNDPPVARPDSYEADEDTLLSVAAPGVLANDTDVEGDSLTAVLVVDVSHGTLVLNADGSFSYTPDTNYNGADSFTYKANDGNDDSTDPTVGVTINPLNDAPVVVDDAQIVGENSPGALVLVLGNDTDVDADTLTVTAVDTTGTTGTVTNNGTDVTYDPNGMFDYLAGGETAADTFTYTASDGHGGTDTATVTITVVGSNDAPVARPDSYEADEDTLLSVTAPGVLADDTDVEGDSLTAGLLADVSHGVLLLNADGSFSYTPDTNYNGADSFTYTITDDDGATDTATVTITVNGINDAVVAVDDVQFVGENSDGALVPVLGNDTDAEGQVLTVTAVDTTGTVGTVTNNGTDVTYDPNGMFEYLTSGETATDTFTYTASDGHGGTDTATVTITIVGANDAPVAGDDSYSTDEASSALVVVVANDSDTEGAVTVTSIDTTGTAGTVTNNNDGTFTYDPNGAFEGLGNGDSDTDTFTYTITDGDGATDTATVTITVNGINDAVVAADDVQSVGENSAGATVPVLDNDTDAEGQVLTVTAVDTTGTSGTVTNNGTDVTYDPNGMFEYLDSGETATDTFTYTASDSQGGTDTATVTITIVGSNDPPSASDDAYLAVQDATLGIVAPGVLTNDTDADGESLAAGNASDPANGTVTLDPDGAFSYFPDAGFIGTDTFTYDVSDGTAVDMATVTITVVPPNATPTADSTSASGNEDAGVITVTLTGRDTDGDSLTFDVGTATNGLVSVPGSVTCDGLVPTTCTALSTYTPNANFNGSDSFTYTVNDGTVNSAAATASLTVNSVNDAPSFTKGDDQIVLEDAGAQTVQNWASDVSPGPADESGQMVSFVVTGTTNDQLFSALPAVGPDGALTFTPAVNASGQATASVQVTDDGGTANGGVAASAVQSFVINVSPVNDEPSFTKGADQLLFEDAGAQSVSGWATAISKGPADESAQTLSFSVSNDNNELFSSQPTIGPAGTLTYTSAPNRFGTATVTVSVSDTGGTANGGDDTSGVQTFSIAVNAVNDAPVAAAKNYTVQANMKISLGGLLAGATDPNDVTGDPSWTPSFTVGSITPGAACIGCTISNVNNADGTFDFDPPAGGTGTFSVTYTVVDNGFPTPGAASAPQTVTFTVDGPVIWFVDANAGVNGTGRLSAPFNNLASATTAYGTNGNQRIFVQDGNVTGNVTLQSDGWLVSDAVTGASFDAVMGLTPPAGTIARPAVGGSQRTLTGTVTLGTNSVVRGFDLTPASGNRGLVASGRTGLVVNQMSVTTTSARAVDLASSSGVFALTRVTATGADRGISLVGTNVSTGSFTVTGTGTAGTGGVISGSTALGTLAAPEGGVYLNNTKNVTLKWMAISSNQANGIYGENVTALVLEDSTLPNNGTNEVLDHSGMHFANLLGTSSIARVDVSGSREDSAKVLNTSGTATLTVANSTFRDNNATVGANGLYIDTKGSAAMTFTSTSNTFTDNNTSGLAIFGQSSQRLNATVTGGTYTTNGVGLDLETNGSGGMLFSVTGGTVTGCAACGVPVNVYKGSGATGTGGNATAGTISGMTITNGNSWNAAGIWTHGEGPGAVRLAIVNNNISQVEHRGIDATFGNTMGGAQTADVSITGNTINQSGIGTLNSIYADAGVISGDSTSYCAHIANNNITNTVATDIRVVNSYSTTSFRLPGYAGSATDTAAVQTFLLAQNTATDATATNGAGAPGFNGGAACAAP